MSLKHAKRTKVALGGSPGPHCDNVSWGSERGTLACPDAKKLAASSLLQPLNVLLCLFNASKVFHVGEALAFECLLRRTGASARPSVNKDLRVFLVGDFGDAITNLGVRNVDRIFEVTSVPLFLRSNVDNEEVSYRGRRTSSVRRISSRRRDGNVIIRFATASQQDDRK